MTVNLLEQLKPEIKAYYETQKESYPNTVQDIYEQLSRELFVSDVRYGIATEIESAYYRVFGKLPMNLWMCFNRPE